LLLLSHLSHLRAGDVMVRDVITVRPEATVDELARVLVENHISGAPIVDGEGHLCGVVSKTDILNVNRVRPRIQRLVFEGDASVRTEEVAPEAHTAGDIMTSQVYTTTEETPVAEIADLMVTQRVNRIPVIRDGKLVGMVTRQGILVAMLKHLEAVGGRP
jgi:CBS domain-containing protein